MTIRILSYALQKKAKEELNEDPEQVDAFINQLREWVDQQLHLSSDKPDQWLIAFLRGCKYNIKKSKEKLKTYYSLSTTLPEIFANRDPLQSNLQEILRIGFFLPLKNCSKGDSPKTCLVRPAAFNGTKHRVTDLIKVTMMIIEILLLEDDNFTISGEEVIIDMKNLNFGIISQWTPMLARRVMFAAEKALSIRLKSVHILNAPVAFTYCFAVFKLILPPKLKNRIHFHSKSYDSMFESVDRSILPIEYGGTGENLQQITDYWKAKVESYRDLFTQQDASTSTATVATQNKKAIDASVITFKNLELD